uniref:Uncharacterized protein n=1 Tax=Amphimedon queenslandica TaxID=400682 RepID=A0A1X7VTH5_AMPQE
MQDIPGSSAHWNKEKLDLFDMLRTLGPRTFFITDDMIWFDLMCVLAKCDGKILVMMK